MSVINTLNAKGREDARNASFVAFARDENSVRELERFVRDLAIGNASVARGGMDDAIAHLGQAAKAPQRLVVDVSGIDMPLLALSRLADACDPTVQVYVLGDFNDVTLYRDLLQAGVQDYLVKPLTADGLRNALGGADGRPLRRTRTGKVITLTGARGGVGVTTVACTLASALTEGKGRRRVVYVDLDLYGGTGATLLGLTPNRGLQELLQNLDRTDLQFLERTLASTDGKLFMLGAGLACNESLLAARGAMARLLEVLALHFHYVVVDLPEPGGSLGSELLLASDMVCVLADHSVHSARATERVLAALNGQPGGPALYVVLNSPRAQARGAIGSKEFSKALSHPVALDIPFDGRAPGQAEDLGEPLPKGSELRKAVLRLMGQLAGENGAQRHAASGMARWFRRTA